ncbi:pitrilysin family protein [Geobacter sp. DSM 9736]|uniref:M16 family metallopeptidase n=1 Tax=Geobacter sp. DSM 9736 TaxID=1277350 RepID=UPI000B508D4C|nr:pitrilysin family protein [Geobacter sp. DSM 9736]SNB45652.1 Predicted Zn-dependent peptidase [Geobacter sp. DSM 9736]
MVSKTVLHNGIRVISEHIPSAYSVSIGFWVASGSRHETSEANGIAHFIEHLLFKGTPRRTALDIAREMDSMGGILNAFTSREYVCYYAKVLDKFLPQAVDLLSDIFLNSLFDPEEIEKERKVVLQEISMLEDNPDDYVHDLFSRNFWKGHSLGMPIIGNEESVGGLSREAIISYRDRTYLGGNIIIAAAGNIAHQDLLKLVEGVFSNHPSGSSSSPEEERNICKRIETYEKDLEQAHLCLGTTALPQDHPLRYEAYILNTVLGGSMSSRLFQEIRERHGLAYSVYSYMISHSDSGSLVIYAGSSPDQVGQVIEIALKELKRLKTEALTATELESAKEQIKGNILLSLESSDNRMSKLAKNEIYFGDYQPLPEIIKGFDRVTSTSLLDLCGELLDDRYFTMVLMGKVSSGSISARDLTL